MIERHYLKAPAAAAYLEFPNVAAFRAWLGRRRKKGLPVTTYRRDGTLLFLKTDLDAALHKEQAAPVVVRRRA